MMWRCVLNVPAPHKNLAPTPFTWHTRQSMCSPDLNILCLVDVHDSSKISHNICYGVAILILNEHLEKWWQVTIPSTFTSMLVIVVSRSIRTHKHGTLEKKRCQLLQLMDSNKCQLLYNNNWLRSLVALGNTLKGYTQIVSQMTSKQDYLLEDWIGKQVSPIFHPSSNIFILYFPETQSYRNTSIPAMIIKSDIICVLYTLFSNLYVMLNTEY